MMSLKSNNVIHAKPSRMVQNDIDNAIYMRDILIHAEKIRIHDKN